MGRKGFDTPHAGKPMLKGLPGAGRSFVGFDFAAMHPNVFFELALGGFERVAQGHVNVLVGLFVVMVAAYDDLFVRHAQIDTDFVEITLMLMMMLRFYGDSATDDVIAELL
jgi:hypothetical protein